MFSNSYLRLLLALFLLYFAWPHIPEATLQIEKIFWGAWLTFLLLVIGSNLATILRISRPPLIETAPEKQLKQRKQLQE